MGDRKILLFVILVLLSGLIGGVFSRSILLKKALATNDKDNIIFGKQFNLVDDKGKTRASLCFTESGWPALGFLDAEGNILAYYTLSPSGPMMTYRNSKEEIRLSIRVNKEGNPGIFFTEDRDKPKMFIGIMESGEPFCILHDKQSTPRMILTVQDKNPRIGFVDGTKNIDMLLTTRPDGQGGMVMQNKHGQIILGMYNDAPVLMLKKGDKTESMSGFTPAGEPFFALRKDGKTAWVAPPGKKAEIESIDPAADWQSITDTLLKQPKF